MPSDAPLPHLRKATPADHSLVVALLSEAGLPVDTGDGPLSEDFVVLESAGRVVGAAAVERYGSLGLLRSVVVSPELRGSGLGIALAEERIKFAQSQGLRELYLLTETAEEFFRRLGFTKVDRSAVPEPIKLSREFSQLCPASAAVMLRRLDDQADSIRAGQAR